MSILLEKTNIDYDKISLGIPNQLYNNSFFTRILLDDKPLIIQSGPCIASCGIKKIIQHKNGNSITQGTILQVGPPNTVIASAQK